MDAVIELARVGLLYKRDNSYWKVTDLAEQALPDPLPLNAAVRELEERSLLNSRGGLGRSLRVHATYAGLVWSSRKGFTIESRFIDDLVAEWETTSVEFKRDVQTDTASEKAELVKDILGLANTQASGRRWLVIAFDPKTHLYFGPPYTDPPVRLRYEVVDYRLGRVGRIEVLRDPLSLPYRLRRSIGDKGAGGKRVEVGQIFVRHGSQTEEPTPRELEALESEAARARGSAAQAAVL